MSAAREVEAEGRTSIFFDTITALIETMDASGLFTDGRLETEEQRLAQVAWMHLADVARAARVQTYQPETGDGGVS